MRRIAWVTLVVFLGMGGLSSAQTDVCSDTLQPLLAQMASWAHTGDSGLGYRFCAFVSGSTLALAHTDQDGFTVPGRQAALWPGHVFATMDSTYQPVRAFAWSEAESLLVAGAEGDRGVLLLTDRPVVVTGVDTSLGAPWFFVSQCDSGQLVSTIWDRDDFKQHWWRRIESPGARVIWSIPDSGRVVIGRRIVMSGMRNAVLAARPDSAGQVRYGLAACMAAVSYPDVMPGSPRSLRQITQLRQLASEFLTAHAELWPPDEREPIKLAAYYLQKSAEAWRTVSVVVETWLDYDSGQRRDWLAAIRDWETKAAVAFDEIVTAQP